MLTVEQLRTPMTAREGTDLVLGLLQSLGFQTTAWQEGRIQHSICKTIGIIASDFTEVARVIVESAFNSYATGDALHEFSDSRFDNQFIEAVSTAGPMRLTSTASIPYTIEVGQLIATTSDGVEFRNTTGGVLSAGTTAVPTSLVLQWKARFAGVSGNVPNSTVTKLLTPLAGVTITNNETSTWYTTVGRDEEDDAALRQRNRTRWSRLSVEFVAEAYENVALNNGAIKVRVDDGNPRGAGTIDVYCAASSAQLGDLELAALQAAFAARVWQTDDAWPRPSPGSDDSRVSIISPTAYPLGLAITIYHRPSVTGLTITTDVTVALQDLIARTPIGGFNYAPGLENTLTLDNILEAVRSVDGVVTATITSPSANIPIDPFAIVTQGGWILTPQAVAV